MRAREQRPGRAIDAVRRVGRVVAVVAVASLLAACDSFDLEPPDTARVVLEGPDGAAVRLVTSNHLLIGSAGADSTGVELVSADTSVVSLPVDRDYAIVERSGQYNFFVEAGAVDGASVEVRMRVLVGGEEWYDEIWDVAEDPHSFFYRR